MMETTPLRVMVIDYDKHFQETYQNYFKTYDNYTLVACCNNIHEVLNMYKKVMPDIVLSEASLPLCSGIDGVSKLRKLDSDAPIIIVSHETDFEIIKESFKKGANGYLTKPVGRKRLLIALDSVRNEGAVLSNDIIKKVINMFQRKSYDFLSDRENDIIEYLGQGATYREIAAKLFVSPSTVNFHIQNIYLKLDVNSKSEALEKLRELRQAS